MKKKHLVYSILLMASLIAISCGSKTDNTDSNPNNDYYEQVREALEKEDYAQAYEIVDRMCQTYDPSRVVAARGLNKKVLTAEVSNVLIESIANPKIGLAKTTMAIKERAGLSDPNYKSRAEADMFKTCLMISENLEIEEYIKGFKKFLQTPEYSKYNQ